MFLYPFLSPEVQVVDFTVSRFVVWLVVFVYEVIPFHSCHVILSFGEQKVNAGGGLDSSIAVPH